MKNKTGKPNCRITEEHIGTIEHISLLFGTLETISHCALREKANVVEIRNAEATRACSNAADEIEAAVRDLKSAIVSLAAPLILKLGNEACLNDQFLVFKGCSRGATLAIPRAK